MTVLYVGPTDSIVLFVYPADLFCQLAELRIGTVRMSYFPWSGLLVVDLSKDKCLTAVMMRSGRHGLIDLWFCNRSYRSGGR